MGGAVSFDRDEQIRRGIAWPVDAIKALVRSTLSERDLPPAVRRRLGLIAQEAETISEVVERLTDQAGAVRAVDVAALVASIVEVERITWEGPIDLLAGGGVTIVGNEADMRLRVHELLDEAKHTTGTGVVLQIIVRRDKEAVAVEAGPRSGQPIRLELTDSRRARLQAVPSDATPVLTTSNEEGA
jgi:hypothetical protein